MLLLKLNAVPLSIKLPPKELQPVLPFTLFFERSKFNVGILPEAVSDESTGCNCHLPASVSFFTDSLLAGIESVRVIFVSALLVETGRLLRQVTTEIKQVKRKYFIFFLF